MSEEIKKAEGAEETEPEVKPDEMSEQDLGNVAGGTRKATTSGTSGVIFLRFQPLGL